MNLTEWNARLHGLVIFRALLDDDVIAKFVDLTDRMAAAPQSTGAVCDAAASFEAALFEHTTNFGEYLSAAVLEAETVCVRQAAVSEVPPVLQTALDNELDFLRQLCSLTLDELLDAAGAADKLPTNIVKRSNYRPLVKVCPLIFYINCSKYFSLNPVSGNLNTFCLPSFVV